MEYTDIQSLVNIFHRKLAAVDLHFKRYIYDQINWNVSMVGIKGARGVGKTTLILQHIKETFTDLDKVMYVSLDNIWFGTHKLEDLVEFLYTHGVTHLFLDEVHRYENWSILLKNFNDSYPDLNIVYTGSCMLKINESIADLSRRQTIYELHGLSFREYLEYEGILKSRPLSLDEILENHVSFSMNMISKIKVLKHFEDYLKKGYYPYYKESGQDYLIRLSEVCRLVIEQDIPAVTDIQYSTLKKLKTLLMVIAENIPLEPNINKLSAQLESTRDMTLKLLYLLDEAGLISLLTDKAKDYKHLVGPKKIYLDNTNLMYALGSKVSVGTIRETFFSNQTGTHHSLTMPKQGDFKVDGKYLFEVGGSGKTFDQIADLPDSYLAIDGIETGSGKRIPLWVFGFLY